MHWRSDDSQLGSDESELLLTFEFLTPAQHQLIEDSQTLQQQFMQLQDASLKLLASGQLRQLFWQSKMAAVEHEFARQTEQQLQKLLKSTEQLVRSGQRPKLATLVAKQRLQQAQSAVAQAAIQQQSLLRSWQQLTDQTSLPDQLPEPQTQASSATHPQLEALQLQWQLTLNQAKQSAASANSWSVTPGLKHINGPERSENQWGIGLSIPLTYSSHLSMSDFDALKRQQQALMNELRQAKLSIERRVETAYSRQQQLKQEAASSQTTAALSQQAIEQLDQLYEQRQIDTTLYIDRLIEQWTYQKTAQLAKLNAQLANALLNQAQGISL
jgi:outer membrane protein TolC